MSAFYEQVDDDTFDSSPLTAGPWSAESQHAGPPSALLTRTIDVPDLRMRPPDRPAARG